MHKTHIYMICGAVAAVILAVVLIAVGAGSGKPGTVVDTPPETADTGRISVSTVGADDPTVSGIEPDTGETTEPGTDTEETGAVTLEDEPLPPRPTPTPGDEADPADGPVTGQTPDDDGPGDTSPVTQPSEPYNCGTPGHHCDSPETHAYILNLEAQGCPYCHKHDCPSFYATDEWGTAVYDPTQCPSYDIHNDPVYYCQNCGKPCGDGTHGTCVRFVKGCNCPICGKWVDAWTCHSCEE